MAAVMTPVLAAKTVLNYACPPDRPRGEQLCADSVSLLRRSGPRSRIAGG